MAGQRTMSGLIVDLTGQTLAGHFDRLVLDTNMLFSIQLSLNVLQCCNDFFFLWLFCCFKERCHKFHVVMSY